MIQGLSDARRARFAILGFASFQACVISLLYMGSNCSFSLGNLELSAESFYFPCCSWSARSPHVLSPPIWRVHACFQLPLSLASSLLMVAGSLAEELLGTHRMGRFLPSKACLWALRAVSVFAAWGRALGGFEIEQSVPCALIGSALGAAVCFLLGSEALPSEAELFICFLPLVSLAFLLALQRISTTLPKPKDAAIKPDKPKKNRFTRRLLLGTLLFGLATGIMQTYGSDPGMDATPTLPVTLVLFILFCLAALQLFGGEGAKPASKDAPRPEGGMLAAISRGVAFVQGGDAGPLGGTYRLSGLLLWAASSSWRSSVTSACPARQSAMSGFLSLIVVMVSLFLVMGKIDGGGRRRHIRAGLRRAYPRRVHGARRRQLLRHRVFRKCGLPSHVRTRWIVRLDRLPLPVHRERLLSALASCHHARSLRCHVPQDQQTSRAFPP